MTARRLSRILGDVPVNGPRDEEHFRRLLHTSNEDIGEHEPAEQLQLQEAVNAHLHQFAREDPDETPSVAVHPALTDYGPDSAAIFFRQTRADHCLMLSNPPASLRAGLRPRSGKGSGSQSKQLTNDSLSIHSPITGPRKARDHSESPYVPKQRSSESSTACMEVERSLSRAGEDLLRGDGNQLLSPRQGPKRARRTSHREQNDNEENPRQVSSGPHGAALLRDMRLRRAVRRERADLSCHNLMALVDQDTQEPIAEYRPVSFTITTDDISPTNACEGSAQCEFQMTSRSNQTGDNENGASFIDPSSAALDAPDLPIPDRWRPAEAHRAHSRRTVLGHRHSTLSPPPQNTQARRQFSRDSVFRALLETPDHDIEASDAESVSSQDALVSNARLADANSNIPRRLARNLPRSLEDDNGEDVVTSFVQHPTAPVRSTEQPETLLQSSASTLPRADLPPASSRSFRYDQIAPPVFAEDRHQKGWTDLHQPPSAPKYSTEENTKVSASIY